MKPLHSIPLRQVFGNLRWGQWQASTPSLAMAVSVSLNLINLSQYWLSSIHTFTHSFTDTHTHTHTHTQSGLRRRSKTWRHTKITPNYFRVRNVTSSLYHFHTFCVYVCVCARARARVCACVCVRVTSMWTRKRQLGRNWQQCVTRWTRASFNSANSCLITVHCLTYPRSTYTKHVRVWYRKGIVKSLS